MFELLGLGLIVGGLIWLSDDSGSSTNHSDASNTSAAPNDSGFHNDQETLAAILRNTPSNDVIINSIHRDNYDLNAYKAMHGMSSSLYNKTIHDQIAAFDACKCLNRYAAKKRNPTANVTYTYRGVSYLFQFEYRKASDGGYLAYIINAPSYGRRSDTSQATHRIRDGSMHYICWAGKITTIKQMDAVAELWAQATVMYIANGGTSIDAYVKKICSK